jgi:hypothetical protein
VARTGAEALDESSRREAESHARDAAAQLGAAAWASDVAAITTPRNVPMAIIGAAEERYAAVIVTGTRGRSRIAPRCSEAPPQPSCATPTARCCSCRRRSRTDRRCRTRPSPSHVAAGGGP